MFTLGAESVAPVDPTSRPPAIVIDATTALDTSKELIALREVRRAALLASVPQPLEAGDRTGDNPL